MVLKMLVLKMLVLKIQKICVKKGNILQGFLFGSEMRYLFPFISIMFVRTGLYT